MASERQKQANRSNALASTGPRTQSGKEAVRYNALKHGILAQEVVLPWESRSDFETMRDAIREELRPRGAVELALVGQVVACLWRLRRLFLVEHGIFQWEQLGTLAEAANAEAETYVKRIPSGLDALLQDLQGPQVEILEKNKHSAACQRAAEFRTQQGVGAPSLGRGFIKRCRDGDTFSMLGRYATSIERTMYRGLRGLEHRQRMRAGDREPAEVASPSIPAESCDGFVSQDSNDCPREQY